MNSLAPGSRIGILGGGQLGRMLAIAAAEMGYRTHVFSPEENAPAFEVSTESTQADYTDAAALEKFAASVDVITLEFENIPVSTIEALSEKTPVHPGANVLSTCQHRVKEKSFVQSLGIGTAPFAAVSSLAQLREALARIGAPAILKTCTLGYDGKGQVPLRDAREAESAWNRLTPPPAGGRPGGGHSSARAEQTSPHPNPPPAGEGAFILEGFVDFACELSVIVCRNAGGEMACYPPVRNVHKNHILHQTFAPAELPLKTTQEAERIARALAEGLNLTGILAVEMFLTREGAVLVNEMAPRPHNSGHWTLDACATSQFEQTIRAVCGLPLGDTAPLCPSIMTNLIGDEVRRAGEYLQNPRMKLHLYGKTEARAGRKMGHATELLK